MDKTPQKTAIEQRRLLLKGALGASTVMTLGYGGAAAAASLSCVIKPPQSGFPTTQFVTVKPTNTGNRWAWKEVAVQRYQAAGQGSFDGYTVGTGIVYKAVFPSTAVVGANLQNNQTGYPKLAWVLVYFDETGKEFGTYPTYDGASYGTSGTTGYAPAAESCLASINGGFIGGYTFGG
ncbi:MAG: hypothetical protein Q7J47_02885 [Azoarcus sp.]|nr:hypothetical protein [Azoarcus sp.]